MLGIMSQLKSPAHRTLTVTDPRNVRAGRIFGDHDLKLDVPAKLRLGNAIGQSAGIRFSSDVFSMMLGKADIASLSGAVIDVSLNRADFGLSFGEDATIINFWWWPEQRRA
ncbi:hypothetical protein AAG610_13435 [Citromicrobium bathyomarinum]